MLTYLQPYMYIKRKKEGKHIDSTHGSSGSNDWIPWKRITGLLDRFLIAAYVASSKVFNWLELQRIAPMIRIWMYIKCVYFI